jgi:predicted enzyme related to lactoylglutathione lyase
MPSDRSDLHRATPVAFLYATDRNRALAFYREALGLELRSSDDFGDFLHMNGALVRMTTLPDHKPSPHPAFGWDVSDIAATVAALRDRGITFLIYDGMGQDEDGIWTGPDGDRIAFFNDSEGNLLSLSQIGH